ncbi:MAG TPA: glycine betaine ABC transporter substrate-binding protein [Acidimicrobiales bacterium]|nr:glycine betaine ABC transporter substrate-binding protein [Acidimicrobiales bacterium]
MRTRRSIIALLLALGLFAAACSDSDDDPSVDAGSETDADDTADDAAPDDTAAPPIEFVPLEPGAVTFEALENGDVDAAVLFSTQGIIAEKDWVVLEDDLTLQGSDNLIPLIRTEVADENVSSILDAVSAALTTEGLTEANRRVDSDKEDTEVVAREYLEAEGALPTEQVGAGTTIVVGSANFSEAEIVAQMYRIALEAAGYTVELKAQLGSREVLVPALESGEIDVEPEYLQSLLVFLDPDAPAVTPEEGVTALAEVLPEGLSVLEPAPAQDQNAIVVTGETAEKYGLTTVSDLLAVTDQLRLAGPPECPERPLCIPGYEEVYGLQFEV